MTRAGMGLAPSADFLSLSAALVQRLPMRTRRWTRRERDLWIAAYTAAVDLHYEVLAASPDPEGPSDDVDC